MKTLRSVNVQEWERCAGDAQEPPSSFCFSHFLSSTLFSVYLSVSQSAPLSLCWLPIQVTLSMLVCAATCVKSVCARQARGTNECLYSAEATGRRIGGQRLPSPPSYPTSLHRWQKRHRDSPPLFPPPPLSFHTSALPHLLLEDPPPLPSY